MKSETSIVPCVEVKLNSPRNKFVAVFDLDEILGDFQEVFCRYTMEVLKKPWVLAAGQYGLEKGLIEQYPNGQQMIDDFYNSPRLMHLPTVPGAQKFFNNVRRMGFDTWAVTGRPGHKYARVVPDTMKWLLKHGFHFDRMVFTRAKGRYLAFSPDTPRYNLRISLEDSAEHSDQMSPYVSAAYLRNRHYNLRDTNSDPYNTIRFDTFDEVEDHIINSVIYRTGITHEL